MQYKVAIETATWTWVTNLFLWFGSVFFYLFFLFVYSEMLSFAPDLSCTSISRFASSLGSCSSPAIEFFRFLPGRRVEARRDIALLLRRCATSQ